MEDEIISEYAAKKQAEGYKCPMQEIATEYNDSVIYPDKVRLNCYYYRHYSFVKDIEMIFATVLHFRVKFAGKRCKYVESCIMSKFLGVFLWGIDFENSKVN